MLNYKYIDIHTHDKKSESNTIFVRSFSMSDFKKNYIKNKNEYISLGIHPWEIKKINLEISLALIEENIISKNISMIGECGLDKIVENDIAHQIEVFKRQIELSEKYNIPIVIHCVKAYNELIELRKMYKKSTWIIHGFNSNKIIANKLINENTFFSFGHLLLKNKKLQDLILSFPIENIFLETDDSKNNIEEMYNQFSIFSRIKINNIQETISENFIKIHL